jgi:hypothetical protein
MMTRSSKKLPGGLVRAMLVPMAIAAIQLPLNAVTFSEHVAPIIFENCASCHRPGEAAPFPLTNYKEVRKRGRLIAEVTGDRFMPPWHPESTDFKFADERRLSDAQIKTLADWVAEGMPEGDRANLPEMPDFPNGWQLGKPDLIVEMTEAYKVPASGPDIYRNFVIPLNLAEDKWVKAIEFRPGAPSVVHHSLFFYDTTGEAVKLDRSSSEPGFQRMGRFVRSGSLGAWAVGGTPRPLPRDLAYQLPKGADLVLSTHFHPAGKVEKEKSVVGFYFTDQPPSQGFTGIQLPPHFGARAGINIPAGEKRYVKKDSFILPVDAKAFGVSAHAHYLGKEMKMEAVLAGGARKQLLWIKDYDFDWQEPYNFAEFVHLPKGTRIESEVVWDNSADNPNNPNNPPKRVRWGRESEDEMGSITLLVVAAEPQQLGVLKREYTQHSRGEIARRASDAGEQWRDAKAERFADIPKAIIARHKARYDKDGDGELGQDERAAALEAWQKFLKSRRSSGN